MCTVLHLVGQHFECCCSTDWNASDAAAATALLNKGGGCIAYHATMVIGQCNTTGRRSLLLELPMLVGHLVWCPFTFTKHTCQGNFHVSCLSTPWPEEWLDSLSAKTLECCGQPGVLWPAGTALCRHSHDSDKCRRVAETLVSRRKHQEPSNGTLRAAIKTLQANQTLAGALGSYLLQREPVQLASGRYGYANP